MNPESSIPKPKFNRTVTINASDEQVKKKLIGRFDSYAKDISEFPEQPPELKLRVGVVRELIEKMPAFWNAGAVQAQTDLSAYLQPQGTMVQDALDKVDIAIRSINTNRQLHHKEVRRTIPAVVDLLKTLAHGEKVENESVMDVNRLVGDLALTREQRKQRDKVVKKARRLSAPTVLVSTPPDLTPEPKKKLSPAKRKKLKQETDEKQTILQKSPPISGLPQQYTKNNPNFGLFSVYILKAAQEGIEYPGFNGAMKTACALLPPLRGKSVTELKQALIDTLERNFESKKIKFVELAKDPYQMLGEDQSLQGLDEDDTKLIPVLLKMLLRAQEEVEWKLGVSKRNPAYLDSPRFDADCAILQKGLLIHEHPLAVKRGSMKEVKVHASDSEPSQAATTSTTTTTATTTTTNTVTSPKQKVALPSLTEYSKLSSSNRLPSVAVNPAAVLVPTTASEPDIKNLGQVAYQGARDCIVQMDAEFGEDLVLATFDLIRQVRHFDFDSQLQTEDLKSRLRTLQPFPKLSVSEKRALSRAGEALSGNISILVAGKQKESKLALARLIISIGAVLDEKASEKSRARGREKRSD